MLIECDRCVMRDIACSDCVVTAAVRARAGPGDASIGEAEGRRCASSAGLPGWCSPLRLRAQLPRAVLTLVARQHGDGPVRR